MPKLYFNFFILIFLLYFSGCSTIDLQRKKVEFPNPVNILPYKMVEPDEEEDKGILLRFSNFKYPVFYRDQCIIYSQISGDDALAIEVDKKRKITFSEGKEKETFYVLTETSTGKESETGSEKILVDSRGKILKFINGEFKTDKGKVKFLSHSRAAVFPEKKVFLGDRWSYKETMEIELDSLLISRKSSEPDKIKVDCRLEGFAVVEGKRCAVISANTFTKRKQHYTTFLKDMKLNVSIFIKEKIFFDWKKGMVIGLITETESFSVSEKMDFSDHSRSRSISILENPGKVTDHNRL